MRQAPLDGWRTSKTSRKAEKDWTLPMRSIHTHTSCPQGKAATGLPRILLLPGPAQDERMLQPHSLPITVNHGIRIEQSQGKELTSARRGAPVPGEAPERWWQQFLALNPSGVPEAAQISEGSSSAAAHPGNLQRKHTALILPCRAASLRGEVREAEVSEEPGD